MKTTASEIPFQRWLHAALNVIFACMTIAASGQKSTVGQAFKLEEKDLIPEGIAYDPTEKVFYVGSTHKQKIVKVDERGRVSDFALSLGEVLGLKVDDARRKLWVCSNSPAHDTTEFVSRVYVFSLRDGALEKKYELRGRKKHLFNDVVVTSDGSAYITDSDGGGVFAVRKSSDTLEEFVKGGELRYPNGIALTPDEGRLLVSVASRSGLVSIDVKTGRIETLAHEKFLLIGIDGLYRYGNRMIAVQNVTFPEAVLELECDEGFTRVVGVRALVSNHPVFDLPTTGVLVGDKFYFIANSQIHQINGMAGAIRNPAELKETVILKVPVSQ